MRTDNPFGNCRNCGDRILWIRTAAGKNMPVNPELISYRAVPGGKERIVTQDGRVIAGEKCSPEVATESGISLILQHAGSKEKIHEGCKEKNLAGIFSGGKSKRKEF